MRSWGQPPAIVTSLNVTVGVEQLSVAVAEPVVAGSVLTVHWMVTFAGHEMTGGVLSSTNMIWTHVDELLHASVAVHVLVIVLSWGQPPAIVTSENVTAGIEQLSVAVAVPVLAGSVLSEHSIVTSTGQVITGGVLSSTKIVWLQVEELLHASVANHVLVIVISWGHAPATVTSLKLTRAIEQLSVAVALPVLAGSVLAVHSIVTFTGQVITGAVLSSTKIV